MKQVTNMPMRIGIIGSGRIVERAHLPLFSRMPDVKVVGVFDSDFDRALKIASLFGIPHVCKDLDHLFQLDLDIALVACPNSLHAAISIAALEANINVMCEKPMATTSKEARSMIESAERMGQELMIGFANRFRPEVIALRRAIQDEVLGEINAIHCGWLRREGIPGSWFTSQAYAGGGALTDLGSHLVDLSIWLAGRRNLLTTCCTIERTTDMHAQASWYLPTGTSVQMPTDVEVSASGFIVFSGPLNLFVEVSWNCAIPSDRTYLRVIGERGIAHLETLFGFSQSGHRPEKPLQIWAGDQLISQAVVSASDLIQPYHDQWRFFIDCLRSDRSLRSWLYDSLATVQVIEAMYEAAAYTMKMSG